MGCSYCIDNGLCTNNSSVCPVAKMLGDPNFCPCYQNSSQNCSICVNSLNCIWCSEDPIPKCVGIGSDCVNTYYAMACNISPADMTFSVSILIILALCTILPCSIVFFVSGMTAFTSINTTLEKTNNETTHDYLIEEILI